MGEKQMGASLPRQDSRKSMSKQNSRNSMAEPFKDKTNWKDSLRDKTKTQQGMEDPETKRFEPRRSMSTRRSSFSSSLGREEDINTPFRSPSPRRAREGTSSPSRSSCGSPTRVTDIATMEEDLANLRGQVGEGGSPLGDYVPFDKFRAGRSEGPSELGIETSTKLSSWRSSRGTNGNSDFGNKSKTTSEFGKTSSNLGKTSYDFQKPSSTFRNLDIDKTSDSGEDWTSSRGRKADSSYGSWTGGSSPARDSSTSPKSSFSSSSNSLGARVGLSTLKKPVGGSWIGKRE